jgi:hypothetical protein
MAGSDKTLWTPWPPLAAPDDDSNLVSPGDGGGAEAIRLRAGAPLRTGQARAQLARQGQHAPAGEFHDQGDAKWIVIRGQLWGHNDTLAGRNRCFLVTINYQYYFSTLSPYLGIHLQIKLGEWLTLCRIYQVPEAFFVGCAKG